MLATLYMLLHKGCKHSGMCTPGRPVCQGAQCRLCRDSHPNAVVPMTSSVNGASMWLMLKDEPVRTRIITRQLRVLVMMTEPSDLVLARRTADLVYSGEDISWKTTVSLDMNGQDWHRNCCEAALRLDRWRVTCFGRRCSCVHRLGCFISIIIINFCSLGRGVQALARQLRGGCVHQWRKAAQAPGVEHRLTGSPDAGPVLSPV